MKQKDVTAKINELWSKAGLEQKQSIERKWKEEKDLFKEEVAANEENEMRRKVWEDEHPEIVAARKKMKLESGGDSSTIIKEDKTLPPNWQLSITANANRSDKYYHHTPTGTKCRSKKEIERIYEYMLVEKINDVARASRNTKAAKNTPRPLRLVLEELRQLGRGDLSTEVTTPIADAQESSGEKQTTPTNKPAEGGAFLSTFNLGQ